MNEGTVVVGFILLAVSGCIGYAIGSGKGRGGEGAALGAILGPIGWILTALLLDYPRKCPACFGGVPEGAPVCKHCGRELPSTPPEVSSAAQSDWERPEVWQNLRREPVVCPVCGFRALVEPEQLSRGVKCEKCGIGFVPTASKHKH